VFSVAERMLGTVAHTDHRWKKKAIS
jgi:hypothetical protein